MADSIEGLPARIPEPQATILVVDDIPSNVALIRAQLDRKGYAVITAANGQEALERAAEHDPDLILLDVMMPVMDGYEVCRRIKGNPDTVLTPIVMVTSLTDLEDRIRGIEAGADDFLTKPFDSIELLARVRSLLRVKRYTDDLEHAETVIGSLALGVEAKDPCTDGHCSRLSHYAVLVGKRLSLNGGALKGLRQGGVLHDVGKIGISDRILNKPGKLTAEEMGVMRQHPVIGERICMPLRSLKNVLPIIRHHHEKFDGSGYPDGLSGEEIPLVARIMAAVDVYDALRTRRPYKPPLTLDMALQILGEETKKGWWDHQVVDALIRSVRDEETRGG